MCDPATASAALAIGGTVANTAYQYQVAGAQEKAVAQANQMSAAAQTRERERQQQFNQQAMSAWDGARTRLAPEQYEQTRQDATQQMLSRLQTMGSGQGPGLVADQPRASEEVRQVISRQTADAAARSRQQIEAAARLSAYDTTGQSRGLALNQNADLLSVLSGLRSGSLGAASVEQQVPAAQASANPWVSGAIGLSQAAGNIGLQQAGYAAGYGG